MARVLHRSRRTSNGPHTIPELARLEAPHRVVAVAVDPPFAYVLSDLSTIHLFHARIGESIDSLRHPEGYFDAFELLCDNLIGYTAAVFPPRRAHTTVIGRFRYRKSEPPAPIEETPLDSKEPRYCGVWQPSVLQERFCRSLRDQRCKTGIRSKLQVKGYRQWEVVVYDPSNDNIVHGPVSDNLWKEGRSWTAEERLPLTCDRQGQTVFVCNQTNPLPIKVASSLPVPRPEIFEDSRFLPRYGYEIWTSPFDRPHLQVELGPDIPTAMHWDDDSLLLLIGYGSGFVEARTIRGDLLAAFRAHHTAVEGIVPSSSQGALLSWSNITLDPVRVWDIGCLLK
jgi:hypothetical protein